jgi:outer membrane protein
MKTMLLNQSKAVAKGLLIVLMATFGSNAVLAQDAAAVGSPEKVAVLDMAAALFNSDRAKALEQQIQQQTADDQAKVRSLAEEATGLQDKLQKDAAVMSDDEKRKTAEQIQEIGVQYQFLVEKLQKLVDDSRQQFQQTYAPNLIQAITAVVEEGRYDMVFRSEAVLHFSNNEYDITSKVTEKLNAQK